MRIVWNICAQTFDDLNSCRADSIDFVWIISHQAKRADIEEPKDLNRKRVITQINSMPQAKIGFNGVESLILKFVGPKLFHETNASAFLLLIKQYADAFLCDQAQCQMQLVMTITPKRMKDIPCHALRMNAHNRRKTMDVSEKQCQRSFLTFLTCCATRVDLFKG